MTRTIPSLLGTASAAVAAEDRRGDVLTAAGLFLIALALDALGLIGTTWPGPDVPDWWFVGPALVGSVALAWRRTRPLVTLGVVTVALVADVALGGSIGMLVFLWESLYAVHLHGGPPARRVTVVGVALLSFAMLVVVGEATRDARAAVLAGLQTATMLVMPLWWGSNVRQGRELAAAAEERERLERERGTALLRLAEAARHDAVRAERTAVARDLHDVVASHLSAITITSGAALAGSADPERDRAALRSIRAESLASLEDMQAMIRVLSAEPAPAGPGVDGVVGSSGAGQGGAAGAGGAGVNAGSAGLVAASRAAQLDGVLEQVRLAGLDLTVSDPDGLLTGATVLPAAVDHAVYRVVREALTNVLKHGGARADLSFAAGGTLELEVRDVGVRPGDAPRTRADGGSGTGTGLVSMRERVESLGGSFEAGPVDVASVAAVPAGAVPVGAVPVGAVPAAAGSAGTAPERVRSDGTGWRVRAALPLPERTGGEPAPAEGSTSEGLTRGRSSSDGPTAGDPSSDRPPPGRPTPADPSSDRPDQASSELRA